MTIKVSEIAKEARALRQWFSYLGGQVQPLGTGKTVKELVDEFRAGENEFDNQPSAEADEYVLITQVSNAAATLHAMHLTEFEMTAPGRTQNMGLILIPVPRYRLSRKGESLLGRPDADIDRTFSRYLWLRFAKEVWERFCFPISLFSGALGLFKLLLAWPTVQAAIGSAVVGAVAVLYKFMRPSK